jgi:hypothetical protein
MANKPVAQHVLKYKGGGNVQVFPLVGGVNTGDQDGSDVGTGGPGLATIETPAAGDFVANRVVEFLNDRYALMADGVLVSSGVYKRGTGEQWARSRGGELAGNSLQDSAATGLHVLYPNGIATLVYMKIDGNNNIRVSTTQDGTTGAYWGSNVGFLAEDNGARPATYGQSIVFKDSIFWAHAHFTGAAGAGSITQYNVKTQSLLRYDLSAVFRNGTACETGLHVHDGVLFAMNRGPAANSIRLAKLQGGIWAQVHSNTTLGSSASGTNSHHALFTDNVTGDLIAIPNGGGGPGIGTQVWRFEDPAGSVVATDITSSVLGSAEGADKYGVGGGSANSGRRWSVFVDTVTDPEEPHTFLTTWIPGGSTECWEWVDKIGTNRPTTAAVELEAVGGLAGISDDHALPYNSVGGGHHTPRSAVVEIVDATEEVLAGTKFFFRGFGEDSTTTAPSSTLTFYGTDTQGTPSAVVPIVPGSLSVSAGMLTDLEAYYHMDEASGARVDSSGSGLDLTENGTVGSTTGIISNAADIPGTAGNYFNRPGDDAALDIGVGLAPCAVQAWVNVDATGSQYFVASKGVTGVDGWQLTILADGSVRFGWPGAAIFTTGAGLITAGAGWQHILGTSDGATTHVYIDGVQQASGTTVASLGSTAAFWVGARNDNAFHLDGQLDEVAIWSRYITPSEVEALYNANSSGGAGKELTEITGLPITPSISGNTIIDFTADNGSTLYSVVLNLDAVNIDEGDIGTIITDLI